MWPLSQIEDHITIEKVIKCGIQLQEDIKDQKDSNTDRETCNLQLLWESFKSEIKKIAISQNKKTYHRITSKIRNLEKDKTTLTAHPDFDIRDDLKMSKALIVSELNHLEKVRAKSQQETLKAKLTHHREKPGGIWSKLGKIKRPRDPIYRLKVPNAKPIQFERQSKRMAKIACDYHKNLQNKGLNHNKSQEEHENMTRTFLSHIPIDQKIPEHDATSMNGPIDNKQVQEAIFMSKNGSATGMDSYPYELWKKLISEHKKRTKKNIPSFNITRMLMEILQDIQMHGVDTRTNFTLGWMCPIYKKKDPNEISNYRPITLLNTDYKILTKAMALQLMEKATTIVHEDQAGFILEQSIFNHIRLAKAIISYAEITEEDGAIITLDQEKAYDKIKHEYLWTTLKAFGVPQPFIKQYKNYTGTPTP